MFEAKVLINRVANGYYERPAVDRWPLLWHWRTHSHLRQGQRAIQTPYPVPIWTQHASLVRVGVNDVRLARQVEWLSLFGFRPSLSVGNAAHPPSRQSATDKRGQRPNWCPLIDILYNNNTHTYRKIWREWPNGPFFSDRQCFHSRRIIVRKKKKHDDRTWKYAVSLKRPTILSRWNNLHLIW